MRIKKKNDKRVAAYGCMRRFCADKKASTAIEYGLVGALLSVGILTGLTATQTSLRDMLALDFTRYFWQPVSTISNNPDSSSAIVQLPPGFFSQALVNIRTDSNGMTYTRIAEYDEPGNPWQGYVDANGHTWIDYGTGLFYNQTTYQTKTNAQFNAMDATGVALMNGANNPDNSWRVNPNNNNQLVDAWGNSYEIYAAASGSSTYLVRVGEPKPAHVGEKMNLAEVLVVNGKADLLK